MSARTSGKVIVGVDGSQSSREALRWGHYLAGILGAQLEAVTAWQAVFEGRGRLGMAASGWDPAVEARQQLDACVDEALGPDAASVTRTALHGAPARVLVEASEDADLLVVGSHGYGGFAGLLLGSASASVARHADCPVLVTRGEPTELPPVKPIVVGVDESPSSISALRWAKAIAGTAPVHAIGVWASLYDSAPVVPNVDPQLEVEIKHEAAEHLEEATREVFGDAENLTTTLTTGGAARVLVEASADASLVVVGSRGLGGFRGLLLGSVSAVCVRHSESAVLVVRGDRFSARSRA